jgi:hypothetical protein
MAGDQRSWQYDHSKMASHLQGDNGSGWKHDGNIFETESRK